MVNRKRGVSMSFNGHRPEEEKQRMKESILEMKEVYNTIKYEWPECLNENANPIDMAISLLDDTSVGQAYKLPEFEALAKETQTALRNVVNEHYDIFNNTIGSYHQLLTSLDISQNECQDIKTILETSTRDIGNRADILVELSQTSARYSEMIEILDAMDALVAIPEKIDQLILDKKIHEVYDVIAQSYTTAEQYNLWSLSAMETTRSYLEMQSKNLFDMILDELQNEIYLKNVSIVANNKNNRFPYLQSLAISDKPQMVSFKTLLTESKSLEQFVYNSANLDIFETAECFTEPVNIFIRDHLPRLHDHLTKNSENMDYSIVLNSTSSASSESFHYMYMLLNTASRLNRLPQVLDILKSSHQQEIHNLINRVTEEVKLRNVQVLNKLSKFKNLDSTYTADIITGRTFNDYAVIVLEDLFGSIFIKSLTVLQKQKVVENIIDKIKERETSNVSYDLKDSWESITKELKALMVNYTYDSSKASQTVMSNNTNSEGNILDVFSKQEAFQFENVSSNNAAKTTEDMKIILENMFPGFVISEENNNIKESNVKFGSFEQDSPYIKSETFNAMVEVLVPRNLFNMRIILEFFLVFVSGAQMLFGGIPDTRNSEKGFAINFFNDYMTKVFLGNLRAKLNEAFGEFVSDKDVNSDKVAESGQIVSTPFNFKLELTPLHQIDGEKTYQLANPSYSDIQVYQNALDFKRLFKNACAILNTSLTHREEYSKLCLNFLEKFADTYKNFYSSLLSTNTPQGYSDMSLNDNSRSHGSSVISTWLGIHSLTDISNKILQEPADSKILHSFIEKETEMLLITKSHNAELFSVTKDDFLDNDSLFHICNLLTTTSWILSWLPYMKKEASFAMKENGQKDLNVIEDLKQSWCFLENGIASQASIDTNEDIYLALSPAQISYFDSIISTFEDIRNKTLIVLRYDLRCKALYFIGNSFKEGDWILSSEPGDADSFIGLYNKEVFSIESKLSSILEEHEKERIFLGLPNFFNKILIQGSNLIPKINSNGIKKVLLNTFSLQQMLKNIMPGPQHVDFSRASVYFELFTKPEYELIDSIKNNSQHFSRAELVNMVRLIYSERLADGSGSSLNKNKYNDLIKKVEEYSD
ncbi:Piso0_002350 [Millerozyma farinosa CBS 7064]|uniref:Exocyst complex component Sec8 n=1 Tax=Pichia sorbitophila (strain ATCC MYA-4447 / BCRC 22081 / CBS 7064 / NBRC 10061 / NRRL Y-12695) TaxID=559304 RepID=G8YET8_PICSO|nr:Piso0_002350 [Millerozyma farinosa CBS 7064]